MLRLITSADRRFAAISKVVRVRVEGSKKRLNTDLPRSSGSFFTLTPTNDFAVSRISPQDLGGQSLEREQVVQLAVLGELRVRGVEPHRQGSCSRSTKASRSFASRFSSMLCAGGQLDGAADELRRDRQLPAAAVDEGREPDARRPAVVEDLVQRRAYRAPGDRARRRPGSGRALRPRTGCRSACGSRCRPRWS